MNKNNNVTTDIIACMQICHYTSGCTHVLWNPGTSQCFLRNQSDIQMSNATSDQTFSCGILGTSRKFFNFYFSLSFNCNSCSSV